MAVYSFEASSDERSLTFYECSESYTVDSYRDTDLTYDVRSDVHGFTCESRHVFHHVSGQAYTCVQSVYGLFYYRLFCYYKSYD